MFGYHRSLRALWSLVFITPLLALSLAACGSTRNAGTTSSAGNAGGNAPTPASTSAAQMSAGSTSLPLKVTGVDIAVSPSSLSSYACGTHLTVTYTATFHFPTANAGGQVLFQYTTNNGRGTTQAALTVPPGQTALAYHFAWSGQLPVDHTEPGPGGIMVTAPNALTSQLVAPAGVCSNSPTSAFKVISIELAASPSLAGHACGTAFTETYTAIFHVAPYGPGGTIVFQYTTNNGRSSTDATVHVAPGQTSATYTFTWSGTLPADHTAPGNGIVLMSAPNQGESPAASPTGQCTI